MYKTSRMDEVLYSVVFNSSGHKICHIIHLYSFLPSLALEYRLYNRFLYLTYHAYMHRFLSFLDFFISIQMHPRVFFHPFKIKVGVWYESKKCLMKVAPYRHTFLCIHFRNAVYSIGTMRWNFNIFFLCVKNSMSLYFLLNLLIFLIHQFFFCLLVSLILNNIFISLSIFIHIICTLYL